MRRVTGWPVEVQEPGLPQALRALVRGLAVRVAVCCPGPSLPRRWFGRIGYDCVYAVNRAMIIVPEADWLSAGDIAFFEDLLPDGCGRASAW
jgi:hypothetical protein